MHARFTVILECLLTAHVSAQFHNDGHIYNQYDSNSYQDCYCKYTIVVAVAKIMKVMD